jgi:hypothetical protein
MRLTRIAPRLVFGLLMGFGLSLNAAASSAQTPAAPPAVEAPPSIVIAEPLYEFPNAVDGTEIVHDFKVQNQGAGVLEIEKVRTG